MRKLHETASQTAGPYLHIGCLPAAAGLATEGAQIGTSPSSDLEGNSITIEGRIFDGNGDMVKDAMVELWQADGNGVYHSGTAGFGRSMTDFATGVFTFETIKPGSAEQTKQPKQSPHVMLWIVARGINVGLHTRMYFPEDDHRSDPVFALIPKNRHETLIARKDGTRYRHDIHLQGPNETVFFDV